MELIFTKKTSTAGIKEYFEGILRMSQSNEKFPADLDDVWHLAYKDRRSATRALHNFYIEDYDYEILLHRGAKQKKHGGHNIKIYKLTAASLEYFVARKNREVFEVYSQVFHKALTFDPMKALRDPATIRNLLKGYAEDNEQLTLENKAILPAVKALKRISVADGAMCITDTAKTLQVQPKVLFSYLPANKWIYRRVGGSGWKAYQLKIQQGLLAHNIVTIESSDGGRKICESVLVPVSGIARLFNIFSQVSDS